jgi:HK97 family phage major capsid protein
MHDELKQYIDGRFQELADLINTPAPGSQVPAQAVGQASGSPTDPLIFARVALTRAAQAMGARPDEYWRRVSGSEYAAWVSSGEIDLTKLGRAGFAQNTLTPELGGALVFPGAITSVDPFLRPQSVVRRNVTNVITTETPIPLARFSEGTQVQPFGEGQPTPITGYKVEVITLSPKKVGGLVPLTSESINAPAVGVLEMLQRDLNAALATGQDKLFLLGTGTQYEPKGLRLWSGNDVPANGTVNFANTISDLSKLINVLRTSNIPMVKPTWFISPRTELYLMTLNNGVIYPFKEEMMANKTIMRIPYEVSMHIPENLGSGADETFIILADMSFAVIADGPGVDVKTSMEASFTDGSQFVSAYQNDLVLVRLIAKADFAVRHPKAVAALTGVKWGA